MNNILIILLLSYPASSYGQNLLSDTKTIKTAKMLEKKGDVEGAISIYEDILARKPNHRQSIQNLKNIYLKYLMYDKGIEFMRLRMSKEPYDVRTYCELGEMYFLNKQKKEATLTWYAGLNKFKHNRSFYRIMLSTLAKHNLGNELSTIIHKINS